MIQTLKGVKITPQGSVNRFKQQNWVNSYAFGGWIYNASTSISYSNKPTEIKLSIVLETSSFSQSNAVFDIKETDLQCGAADGGLKNETWFDIDLEGVIFTNFILYSYDYSIEVGQKILNVTFKDYSIILDKIYVGLFKKQGYLFPKVANCQIELPIRCQDCEYQGGAITGTGITNRDIGFGSYVGINGGTYDNFSNFYYGGGNVYDAWQSLINTTNGSTFISPQQFDLNGGYLILGTESATEERCNSAPNITYSFVELLSSLRYNGLKFNGAFPFGTQDSDFVYRNNHIGSLREVLQNWCSDLGYDFYCSGRNFIGIDFKSPINISNLMSVADPNSDAGKYFAINSSAGGNSAILSFKTNVSLENTFKQSVIVENSYPITQIDRQKTVKKFVGITPLHPISLNQIDTTQIADTNIYGESFNRPRYETNAFDDNNVNSLSYVTNFARLDGRNYHDLDAAIALSNYNDVLRDIYVAQKALANVNVVNNIIYPDVSSDYVYNFGNTNSFGLYNLFNSYCVANFNALGMFPILEIFNSQMKADILTDYFSNGEKDGVSNLNMDQNYFKIYLGYYNEDLKGDVVEWEKQAAGSMYKYGVVTKGPLKTDPYVSPNILTDISPTKGFYGQSGLVYQRVKNNFSPGADRYQSPQTTPFIDTLLYSGFVRTTGQGTFPNNNGTYPAFVPPGYSNYAGRIPTGLWIATLENDWGTIKQDFDRMLSFSFDDVCAQQYSLDSSVSQIMTDSDRHAQDWKLDYFRPIASSDLSKISDIIQSDEYDFDAIVDNVMTIYTDTHWVKKKECKKLHVLIIPNTRTHPNLQIQFNSNKVNKINQKVLNDFKQKLYQADLDKSLTETQSICSLSLLEEMCQNILSGGSTYKYQFNPPLTNQQTGCVILEDKNNYMLDGFPSGLLYTKNSRNLSITINKNPGGNINTGPITDENGDYYYADLEEGFVEISTKTATLDIVYPIQSFANSYASYSGLLSSDITTEYRLPALNQIYGSPINLANNNTSSFKIINNTTDNTLNPQLDPLTNEVKSYITVITGGGSNNVITTPSGYYEFVKNLNNYNLDTPTKTINMTLAGPPSQFGNFINYLNPASGLNQISITVADNGVKTELSFSDRPKTLAKQESILNKIGPRIKGNYN